MALIFCGDCQKEYSDYAEACPECGRPNITQKNINNNSQKNDYSSNITSKGYDLRYDLYIDFKEAVFGVQKEITIPRLETCKFCKGNGRINLRKIKCISCEGYGVKEIKRKLRINIPAGVDKGTKLRISGEGSVAQRGGTPGDLYIFIIGVIR